MRDSNSQKIKYKVCKLYITQRLTNKRTPLRTDVKFDFDIDFDFDFYLWLALCLWLWLLLKMFTYGVPTLK